MFHLKRTLCIFLVFLVSCFSSIVNADQSTMDRISNTGEFRIAVQTQGPPVSFIDKNGKRTGLAIEMARTFADEMGVKLVIKDYDWKGLIPALISGKVDMIAADMTPTPKRHMKMLFTDPAFFSEVVVFAKKDKNITDWKSLNSSDYSIAAAQASSYATQARKKLPDAKLKEYSGATPQVVQSVLSDRVDAGVGDRAALSGFLKQNPELEIVGSLHKEPLSFAVRPDSVHLLLALNNYLRLIRYDGRHEKMLDYWWNSTNWQKDHD
ncbi:amino acid ABC transporter substrate-binding protein [Marinobacter santoriniensis NKSG1]|uniref:Amino acid ABC transporter substrate-binding protein n=1 Tax=Marinobacter santoriniensis NKSG1 TaxID=1288826 RepID=M7CV03_9GAMM|nr:ABC transporter substrate-binding protein [Marinobacter santoriniensis]EMP56944.1 amino acid ABC transporter substrate-binding protein [Marinobacter santoriniensis NKSG1]